MNYEHLTKKDKLWGEIGYGIMWIFVAVLIEGIAVNKGFVGPLTHALAVLPVITSVRKFFIAFKKL